MNGPFVTFAIPAYSRPALLKEALDSIAAQVPPANFEVVVCDDGASAEARRQVEGFPGGRARYIENRPPLGAVGNWNRCLREAGGAWITVLHEDDRLYPWWLAVALAHARDTVGAVATLAVQGAEPPPLRSPEWLDLRPAAAAATRPPDQHPPVWRYPPRYFIKSSMTPFPGVLVRRELALELGGFDERWGPLADYEFWYRLACAAPVEVVRERAAFYRVAPGQWTERSWERMLRLTHLLRLRIAREQFQASPRLGRWLARFFTYRNARAYAARFPAAGSARARPAALARALSLRRIPFSSLPSGWPWQLLKWTTPKE